MRAGSAERRGAFLDALVLGPAQQKIRETVASLTRATEPRRGGAAAPARALSRGGGTAARARPRRRRSGRGPRLPARGWCRPRAPSPPPSSPPARTRRRRGSAYQMRGGEGRGNEGPRWPSPATPAKGGHGRTHAGEEAAQEDAGDAPPAVGLLERGHHPRRHDLPAPAVAEEAGTVASARTRTLPRRSPCWRASTARREERRRSGPGGRGRPRGPPRCRREQGGRRSRARRAPSAPGRSAPGTARRARRGARSSTQPRPRGPDAGAIGRAGPPLATGRSRRSDRWSSSRPPGGLALQDAPDLGRLDPVALAVSSGTRNPRSPAKPQHSAKRGISTRSACARATARRSGEPALLEERAGRVEDRRPRSARGVTEPGQDLAGPERREVEHPHARARSSRRTAATESARVPAQGEASVTTGSRPSPEALPQRLRGPPSRHPGGVEEALAREGHPAAEAVDVVRQAHRVTGQVAARRSIARAGGTIVSPGRAPTMRVRQLGKYTTLRSDEPGRESGEPRGRPRKA